MCFLLAYCGDTFEKVTMSIQGDNERSVAGKGPAVRAHGVFHIQQLVCNIENLLLSVAVEKSL